MSIDIRKAFDSVPKNSLLSQLKAKGIPNLLLRLVKSYLSERVQMVKVNSFLSRPVEVLSGVAQGSVLGGYLFAAYVDEVLRLPVSAGTTLIMYADDLVVLKPIPTVQAEKQFQEDLNIIHSAYKNLFLEINPAKSQQFTFSLAPRPQEPITMLNLQGTLIPKVEEFMYLGFLLDRQLNFGRHAARMETKSKRAIGVLFRSFGRLAGSRILQTLYCTKVLPICLYGLAVASPSGKESFAKYERLNRFAARLVSNDYTSSYHHLLFTLGWKSISQICFERRCMLAYKYMYGIRHLPAECVTVAVNTRRHSDRLKNINIPHDLQLIDLESIRASVAKFPFSLLVQTWNSLPFSLVYQSPRNFRLAIQSPLVYATMLNKHPDTVLLIDNL